jgi:hypothetical protein
MNRIKTSTPALSCKRLLLLLILCLVTSLVSPAYSEENCCEGIRGNVDGDLDNLVNHDDVLFLRNYLLKNGPEPACFEEADVDATGFIDVDDLKQLAKYLSRNRKPKHTPSDCPHTPVLAPIGDKTVDENENLNFLITATDEDGTIPSLSASGLPNEALFSDNFDGSGTFDWTPTYDQSGTSQVTFAASDDKFSDEEAISITVNNVEQTWEQPLSGIRGHSVTEISGGGFIVTGRAGGNGYDAFLIKTDANGNTVWARSYGETGYDIGYSVIETSDAHYLFTGSTRLPGSNYSDLFLVKVDADGTTLWTKTFGGPGADIGFSVIEDSDDNYVISGSTKPVGGVPDIFLIKTNSDGEELWSYSYGGNYTESGRSVQETSDGSYIVTGSYGANGVPLYKILSDGSLSWGKIVGTRSATAYSAFETSDGGFLITGDEKTGTQDPYGGDLSDMFVSKTDSDGYLIVWNTLGHPSYNEFGAFACETSNGNFVFTGRQYSPEYSFDVILTKTDQNANVLWENAINRAGIQDSRAISETSDGGFVITGSDSNGVILIKTDSDGYVF